ncbi:MAG: hypothetical protein ACTSXP_18055 [Promethearchaeota archaeon]
MTIEEINFKWHPDFDQENYKFEEILRYLVNAYPSPKTIFIELLA